MFLKRIPATPARAWPSPAPRGRLKGRQPKLSARQQAELVRMHGTGEYIIADLMEVFSVGRATLYRALGRARRAGSEERRLMAEDLEARHVEVTGRALALGAAPVRDTGVDLFVFTADCGWPQPVQVKARRDRDITVYQGFTRGRLDRLLLQASGDLRVTADRLACRLAGS